MAANEQLREQRIEVARLRDELQTVRSEGEAAKVNLARLEGDPKVRMPAKPFETTTPYTVTSSESMRVHVLVTCTPPGVAGRFVVRGRPWSFRCSS